MVSERNAGSSPSKVFGVFSLGFALGCLFMTIFTHLAGFDARSDKVCESVSKGSVWDDELELCVRITKDAVSDERIK